jgi:hypothetical protein
MKEYRQRKMAEALSLEGEELEAKIEEYIRDGLTKDDLFMDMVFKQAMLGSNAKYAELWWRMSRPEPESQKQEMTLFKIEVSFYFVSISKSHQY